MTLDEAACLFRPIMYASYFRKQTKNRGKMRKREKNSRHRQIAIDTVRFRQSPAFHDLHFILQTLCRPLL
ncbi:hypothetical protein [Paenibacillus sp. USDA918EY]|uniref:hypothetical protein n=1 Tax=Paenibacillus sp. USDA918EY TaxID=2689575 RepID=UPI001F220298|nr:hypothetical protein [Paenibacillus sp. USDA918EY]